MGNPKALIRLSNAAFPGLSPSALRLKLRMLLASLQLQPQLAPFTDPPAGSSLAQIMQIERPEIIGAVLWPYQNALWDAKERLTRIAAHYAEIDRIGAPFQMSIHDSLTLIDLNAYHSGLHLVLDQPEWFVREGGLTLNMFVDDFRAYSIAFSLFRDKSGTLTAYIGAIQGRNTPDALDLYRNLTKSLFGQRPRDFLIEALRMLLPHLHVEKLYAVADEARHHRHPYFKSTNKMGQDYDSIWEDRGGVKCAGQSYELPIETQRRPLEEIKAKKRSLYRQRYAFLDQVSDDIAKIVPQG